MIVFIEDMPPQELVDDALFERYNYTRPLEDRQKSQFPRITLHRRSTFVKVGNPGEPRQTIKIVLYNKTGGSGNGNHD